MFLFLITINHVYKSQRSYRSIPTPSWLIVGDSLLKNWIWAETSAATLSKDFGSGYPSDETCVKW